MRAITHAIFALPTSSAATRPEGGLSIGLAISRIGPLDPGQLRRPSGTAAVSHSSLRSADASCLHGAFRGVKIRSEWVSENLDFVGEMGGSGGQIEIYSLFKI